MNRDDLIELAIGAPRPERSALLVAAHASQLRPLDRLALLLRAPRLADLLRLSHYEVELAIGRPLRGLPWQPAALLAAVERDLAWLSRAEHHLWWVGDADYPAPLRRVYDPPAVLFGRGSSGALGAPTVALVGTRRPSAAARSAAFRMGAALAAAGASVVSGLALGIDGAAHAGVVSVGGHAVAVLGSGIDTVMPRSNRPLAAELLHGGGIILSEYPPGTPAARFHFPARNRIVANLADILVVTEAPAGSGALISVEYALDTGIEVFVDRAGAASDGCRALVADGAVVADSAAVVLDALEERYRTRTGTAPRLQRAAGAPGADPLAQHNRAALALFGDVEGGATLAAARRKLSRPRRDPAREELS